MAEARAILAPFTGHPSPFPVDAPLKAPPPPGTHIAYLDCAEPICGLMLQLLGPAAKTAGVSLDAIKAGATASTVAAAFGTVLSKHPSAVIVPAFPPESWGQSAVAGLKAEKIPVIMVGSVGADKVGLGGYPNVTIAGAPTFIAAGKAEAAYIVAHESLPANVAFVTVPDLAFQAIATGAFTSTLKKLCPKCSVTLLPLAPSALGTTSQPSIVSLLQAHPDIKVVTTMVADALTGLTPDLRQAGLSVHVIGSTGSPEDLQNLKTGNLQAIAESDTPVMAWSALDAGLRAAEHQPFTAGEVGGLAPFEILEPKDLQGVDVSHGWTGYPNFAARFARLWHR